MINLLRNKSAIGYIVLIITIAIVIAVCAGAALNEGSTDTENSDRCGKDLVWKYDEDSRTLTVSGTGPMYDYYVPRAPWTCISGEIENIVLPEGLTHIGRFAFSDCSGLGSVTIPSTVRSIGEGAFNNCKTLDSVYIPASVKTIDMFAFKGCSGLKEINVDPDSGSYCSENGVLFSKDRTVLVRCPQGLQSVSVTVPDSVTAIGNEAFYGCGMTSVDIPDSVKKIGDWAFYGCGSLLFMTVPDSVTSIGDWAFYGCGSLLFMTVPDSVKTIGIKAFGDGSCETVYYSSNPHIRPGVYGLPKDATVIRGCGPDASGEGGCGDGLTWKYFEEHRLLVIYGSGAMDDYNAEEAPWYGCRTNIECAILTGDLTHIGSDAFCGMSGLRSVTIPETVISIGSNAFEGCEALTSVFIPGSVTAIGDRAFDGCGNLQKIDVDPANSRYSSEDGILYDKEKTVLIRCPAGYESESVTIPASVTAICEEAFCGCHVPIVLNYSGLTVEPGQYGLPDDVLVLANKCGKELLWYYSESDCTLTIGGSGAMDDYDYETLCFNNPYEAPWYQYIVESAVLLPGITHIGNYAFYEMYELASVTIPETVISIGDCAFCEIYELTSVTIPETVISIGSEAFEKCEALTSVFIPASVTTIGDRAFDGFGNLREIDVDPANSRYSSKDGILYDKEKTVLIRCPAGYESSSVTVPGSVISICEGAFCWCKNLVCVSISDSVETIGYGAFQECESLAFVSIPDSVLTIGDRAFYCCYSLTSLTIPDSVKTIGSSAFKGCRSLAFVSIPESIEIINKDTFAYCRSLVSVTIPDSVKTIDEGAFWGCTSLTSLTIPVSVEIINEDAFASCTSLTSVTIPGSVTSIASYAFYSCMSLTSVTIPGSVTSIGKGAFSYCGSLTSVTIPGSVTTIGDNAFAWCTSLISVTIPVSVTEIGTDAFCSRLSTVHNYSKLDIGPGDYGIPKNATVISHRCGDDLIWDYTGSDRTLTVGGTGAMKDCDDGKTPWQNYRNDIEKVELPAGLTHIGSFAFSDCSSLTSVTIPMSVTAIGKNAFYNSSLSTVHNYSKLDIGPGDYGIPKDATVISHRCGDDLVWDYTESDRTLTVSGSGEMYYPPKGSVMSAPWSDIREEIETVVLPQGLTSICEFAFSSCRSLVSVTIPDTVRSVGDHAFSGCEKLTSLELPDSVTAIGFEAFYCCGSLKTVNIPCNVTEIGNRVFTNCYGLTEIYNYSSIKIAYSKNYNQYGVPENTLVITDTCGDHLMWKIDSGTLTLIGHGDMYDYEDDLSPWYYISDDIENIVLPEGLRHIGSYAFSVCSSLTSVTMPDSVTSIGDCAFYGCISLDSVTIPDSVTSIGNYAFYGCTSVTSVTLGGSVESIGDCAFRGCSIKEVYNHSGLIIIPGQYGLPKDAKILRGDD